jgi:bifunctional UDP-N-acetylglucosamine pyrophosphorylase/glucosamine-1-phosphate N-acetyltransferase
MTDVMILAAGLGTRMRSRRAKVLHERAGTPLVSHVLRAALGLAPEAIFTVVGHQAAEVERAVRDQAARLLEADARTSVELQFVSQTEQKGTGHAVMAARDRLANRRGPLVIVAGHAPLIESATHSQILEAHRAGQNDATVLTVMMDDPTGYGRIIRDKDGGLLRCVEQKDASAEELLVREVGVSIYCF